jgi:hypothetical protein
MTVLASRARHPRPGLRGLAAHGRWRRLLAGPLALLAGACAPDPGPPRWISLAQGFEPRALAEQVAEWERAAGASTGTRVLPQPFGLGLEHALPPDSWRATETAGLYAAELPRGALRACGLPPRLIGRGHEYPRAPEGRAPALGEFRLTGTRLQLTLAARTNVVPPTVLVIGAGEHAVPSSAWRVDERVGGFALELPPAAAAAGPEALRLFAELVRVEDARALAPFEYRAEAQRVLLAWPGETPPPAMQLALRLETGRAQAGHWELRLGRLCGNGIPVWSGAREELVRDLPAESELSFRFAFVGADAVVARVRLADETLWEQLFAAGEAREPVRVALPLLTRARVGARLAFEVEGAPGLAAFFAPTVAPRARGTPGARPYPTRPDLVLFLADTLRADALEQGGGDPALAPALNRFAAQSLSFTGARANASWTLPSISSMLTGLHPGQHGATDEDLTLPDAHVTIAERLAEAGYRTGAITDGSFFAPIFGLGQGFEWFSQRDSARWDLDATLAEARAFLAEDDGRPVFLVVHTYRVHQPYRVGPEEDRSAYDALMERARVRAGTDSPGAAAGFGVLTQLADELRALYEAGVRDLDRGFGAFVAELEAQRFFERGTLVFTSDHGEALGENGEFFHGRTLWEAKLRVPLCLRGPGLAPRALALAAGPYDLAPTFAALAGLAPDPHWVGRPLAVLAEERPGFAFQLTRKSRQVALFEGTRKVLLTPEPERLARGECAHAFELAADPEEAHDLAPTATWPAELTRRLAPHVLEYLAPRAQEVRAGLSLELQRELEALGYGGDER